MIQLPNFLNLIRGIKFGYYDLAIIVCLKLLEWLNFINIVTFAMSMLIIFYDDIWQKNINLFLLQCKQKVDIIINPMMFLSIIYGILFLINNTFFVPYGNMHLKSKIIEIYKDNVISSIQPMHIVNFQDWNFSVSKRPNNNRLEGLILNKESNPSLTLLIKNIDFKNDDFLQFSLNDAIGKFNFNEEEFLIKFSSGKIIVPSSFIKLKQNEKMITIFNSKGIIQFLSKFSIFFVSISLPFWVFTFIFQPVLFQIYLSTLCMFINFFMSLEIFEFNIFIFFICIIIVYLFYRKTKNSC